ncbi:hypothetical protein HC023_25675, partial [Streptomyces sp. NEAU-H3]|nr:hypothetical protein [Streptomyces sp. NEAU-H3]
MAQWNLSVDLRASGDQLARTLRDDANAARALGREARRAQRDIAALGRAASRANRDLRDLRNGAIATAGALGIVGQTSRRASREIRTLDTNAARATRSARALGSAQQEAATHAGTYSTAARALNADLQQLDQTATRLGGSLGGSGTGLSGFGRDTGDAAGGTDRLRKALVALLPALVPIAAQAGPLLSLAGGLGAAGVSAGAFGAAIAGQVSSLSEAAEAQTKYEDAVSKSGARSEEALKAQAEYLALLKKMPAETRRAAAAYTELRDAYQDWSDSLAGDTMPVAIKGMGLLRATMPKLTPLVKDSSREFEHMLDVIAGASQTPGLDSLIGKVDRLATRTLSDATSGAVRLGKSFRDLDKGPIAEDYQEFMAYARANGPMVADTVEQLVGALLHLLVAASDTGISLLSVVNALAKVVNAVPQGAISAFLQLYTAFKLAAVGAAALNAVTGPAIAGRVAAYFAIMNRAGVGTTLRATAASMTRVQKATVGLGALALVAVGIDHLADKARGAPPDVDRLTTSLKNLAMTGKITGELKDTFGDFDGIVDSLKAYRTEADKAKEASKGVFGFRIPVLDDVAGWFGDKANDIAKGSKSLNALKDDFKGVDQALAQLASSGGTKQAAAGFDLIERAGRKAGMSTKDIAKLVPEYKKTVESLKVEQQLAAAGMGLFGQQALATKTKLDAQKASADGLRQSIQALNDVNRSSLGGMIGFEQAIADAGKAAKKNAGALTMSGGQLNLNSEKARTAATALNDLAAKTDEAATAARES